MLSGCSCSRLLLVGTALLPLLIMLAAVPAAGALLRLVLIWGYSSDIVDDPLGARLEGAVRDSFRPPES